MDILDCLREDHEKLRRLLDRISGELCQARDAQGLPAGWTVRSEAELERGLRRLFPALLAHEEVEEKILFRALREAGESDEAVFRALGSDHKELEALVQALSGVLTGAPRESGAWLVVSTLRLIDLLREHMRREEYDVFPMVRSTLSARQLKDLGRRAEAVLRPGLP